MGGDNLFCFLLFFIFLLFPFHAYALFETFDFVGTAVNMVFFGTLAGLVLVALGVYFAFRLCLAALSNSNWSFRGPRNPLGN